MSAEQDTQDSDDAEELQRISDPTFKFNTTATPIRYFFQLVNALVDEAKLVVGERENPEWNGDGLLDGIHVKAVDPANVAYVSVSMPSEGGGFTGYHVPDAGHTLGVKVDTMLSNLKFARMVGRGVDDDGDPVTVAYDDEVRRLETTATRPNQKAQRVTTWNLIDPDSIRSSPDITSFELKNVAHPGSTRALRDAVKQLKGTADHVRVRADPDNDTGFQFGNDGGDLVSSDFVRFTEGYEVRNAGGEPEDDIRGQSSLFSVEFLEDIVTVLHKTEMDKVTIFWGNEFPVVFQFLHEDYGIRGLFMLAPRIKDGDD